MTASLSILDKYNKAPTGPVVGEPHGPTEYRTDLGQLTENLTFLFNRLAKIFGDYQLISSVSAGGNTLEITAHGLPANTVVRVESVGGSVPSGLSAAVGYYVLVSDADNIQLSITSGGAAVDITGTGSGTLYLYTVPDALNNIVPQAITFTGSNTLPAVASLKAAFLYVMSIYGGTMVGPVVHSGTTADVTRRVTALSDTATQTITGTDRDLWYCLDVSQNSTYTVADPTAAGKSFVISRRNVGGGFAAAIRRADASLMATLPDAGASWVRFWSHAHDGVLMWHAEEWGGAAANLD